MSGRGLLLLLILVLVLVLPTLLARCYESEGTRRELPPRERKRAQRCCCMDGTNGLLCPTDGGGNVRAQWNDWLQRFCNASRRHKQIESRRCATLRVAKQPLRTILQSTWKTQQWRS